MDAVIPRLGTALTQGVDGGYESEDLVELRYRRLDGQHQRRYAGRGNNAFTAGKLDEDGSSL